jgi:hypothetical protein
MLSGGFLYKLVIPEACPRMTLSGVQSGIHTLKPLDAR